MHRTHAHQLRAVALILLTVIIASCRNKPASVGVPSAPASEAKAAEFLARGDAQFGTSDMAVSCRAEFDLRFSASAMTEFFPGRKGL
jgi:hypothetical protein